ncbi:MAG: hypothetical protein AB7I48_03975 [Planctomycetaceae bacterium]
MHRINLLVAAIGLLAVGCSKTSTAPGDSPAPPTTVTANKPAADEAPAGDAAPAEAVPPAEDAAQRARRELGEAGDAVTDWAAETKEKLVEKAEQRLAELDEEIAQLEGKSQELKEDAKVRWEQSKQDLEQKRQEVSRQLDELKNSSDEAWKTFAGGIAKAFADLKQSSKDAAAEFDKE